MITWIKSKLTPTPPPYDPFTWRNLPLPERAQLACHAWALQGFGAPISVYLFYLIKIICYVAVWFGFCALSPVLGGVGEIHTWWSHPIAFQKAILWSMLFEVLGLGCGSGPLAARYFPPFGGSLYFVRVGTTKRALWPHLPLLGGYVRSWLDVSLYVGFILYLLTALISPEPSPHHLMVITVLLPVLGLMDQTVFLIARAEHYWMMTLCFFWAGDSVEGWLSGVMLIQLALWAWAGVSKLNPHFPSVIAVMLSNHPLNRSLRFRRALYKSFPDDLRPSRLARLLAHLGAAAELLTPLFFICACTQFGGAEYAETWLILGIVMGVQLHLFITSNVPMAAPIEWNILILYSIFALFWAHPDVNPFELFSLAEVTAPTTWPSLNLSSLTGLIYVSVLLIGTVCVPLIGNLSPRRISFLLAMRYYAGNWPYSVWLFRGDAHERLRALKMTSPWIFDQLKILYDEHTIEGVIGRVLGFRLMHLQGRPLNALIPLAIDHPLSDYRYMEGEVVSGLVVGWNFGDGHLHQAELLKNIQTQCHFEPGELRCIFVESQPLGGDSMCYQVYDAAEGLRAQGEVKVSDLEEVQPWEAPPLISTPIGDE